MRILYLNPAGGLGGAERALLTMLAAVRRARPEVELHLLAAAEGPLLAEAAALGVQTQLLPLPATLAAMGDSAWKGRSRVATVFSLAPRLLATLPAMRRYVRLLRGAVERVRPDVLHSNGLKTHLLARMTGWNAGPVVWHLHDFLGERPLMARLLRAASGRTASALAVSGAVADDARRVLPGVQVEVVHNGVDVDHFTPGLGDGRWLDALAGLPPLDSRILRVGLIATYARWKGHLVFLEAAAHTLKQVPPESVRFFIVGGPIYQTSGSQFTELELRTHASRLGLGAHVGFIPFQQHSAPIYRALDVVVHASTRPEPFGLVIVEAMACGRPVIAVRAGGAAEIFTPEHDALGVPPHDPNELASAILRLANDADLRERLASQARRTVATRFRRERLGENLLAIYDRLTQ